MKTLVISLVSLKFVTALHAQSPASAKTELPPGPLIQKRAPEFAQWVMKMPDQPEQGKAASTATRGQPARATWGAVVVITKTGSVMLRQTTDENKQVWNTWVMSEQGLQTTVSPDGKNWIVQAKNSTPGAPTPNYEDYSRTDFPNFEWIAESNYAGIENIGGRRCLFFSDRVKLLSDDLEPTPVTAYVDLDTRLPVAINLGGNARTYEFHAPPTTPLKLPPLVNGLLDNRQKTIEAMKSKPVKRF